MTTVTVTDTFDHPVSAVWPHAADFGGLAKYMRGFDSMTTVGTGLGQDRVIPVPDGQIIERLTWCDPASYTLSYTIISGPVPFENYVATIKLSDQGNSCGIEWQGNFTVAPGATEADATKMAEGVYRASIKGFKRVLDS